MGAREYMHQIRDILTLTAQGPLLLPSEQSPPAPSWRRTLLLGADDDNAALATAVRCAAEFFSPKDKMSDSVPCAEEYALDL